MSSKGTVCSMSGRLFTEETLPLTLINQDFVAELIVQSSESHY